MSSVALDDMLGQFDRTSTAYQAGYRLGRERMLRECAAILEKMCWDRESSNAEGAKTEFNALRSALALTNKISPHAAVDK